jgi:glyoxylase-like metal-dependent hydrolase (beta-lactamase superfamily II)
MRTNLILRLVGALFAATFGLVAFAQQPPPLTVMNIKANVYWVRGGGGSNDGVGSNNGFIVGTKGIIVIDTKTTVDVEKGVIAAITKVTPKPIDGVILTHSDDDHVNGLPALPAGITIIAQENCKRDMEAAAKLGFEPCVGCRTQGQIIPTQSRLPTKTFASRESFKIDGVRIGLYHWAAGHTSGDTVVYLPDEKIVFAGDLLVNTRPDPLIHTEKKGSATGWIANARGMLALDADTYVTGHGTLMSKADVQSKLDYVQGRYNEIKSMVAEGKSLDDIKTAFGQPTGTSPSPNGASPAVILIEVIYKEVTTST